MHHNPSSLASKPAWKVLEVSSWLLFGRPAVNAWESNCAHYLEARLDLFWAEDWPALWALVLSVMSLLSTVQHAEQQQNKISHAFAR